MRVFVLLFILLCVVQVPNTQANLINSPLGQGQNVDRQSSAKLTAAERLSAQVIKLYSEGKFDEALPLAKQVFQVSETVLGPNHVQVATAASNLAELYIAKGKYKEAEPLFLRAIEINDKVLKPTDPILVKTLERYTCLLTSSDQFSKLKEFEKGRVLILETSGEPDRFWGALWGKTRAISMPKPEYPEAAKRAGASGLILIKVNLDEEGKVVKAESMCGGNPLLMKASKEAASKAQFKPISVGGKPVKIIGYVSYKFVN